VVLLCILCTLWLGGQSRHLGLQASLERMLPAKHPYIQNYLERKQELKGLGNALRIGVETTQESSIFDRRLNGDAGSSN